MSTGEEVVSSSDATEVLAEEGIGQPVAAGRSHGLLRLMKRSHAARDHGQDGRRSCMGEKRLSPRAQTGEAGPMELLRDTCLFRQLLSFELIFG